MAGEVRRRGRRPKPAPDLWTSELIARRIRRLRQVHGETLRQAAVRCGMSAPTYMRWEQGHQGRRMVLLAIATAYDVPLNWLQGEHDPATDMMLTVRWADRLYGPGDPLCRLPWAMGIG